MKKNKSKIIILILIALLIIIIVPVAIIMSLLVVNTANPSVTLSQTIIESEIEVEVVEYNYNIIFPKDAKVLIENKPIDETKITQNDETTSIYSLTTNTKIEEVSATYYGLDCEKTISYDGLDIIFTITGDTASKNIDATILKNEIVPNNMLDNSIYTSEILVSEDVINITSQDDIGYIYIKWATPPTPYSVKAGDNTIMTGQNGFLHEVVEIDGKHKEVSIINSNTAIADIFVYSKGKLPKEVQYWEVPQGKYDILCMPTHADDDTLYMGALISEYAAKGKRIMVSFLTHHNNTVDRPHELLDGVWEMGVTSYPVVSDFLDMPAWTLEGAMSLYDVEAMKNFQIENIRKFKPTIIIGHDENGEYGHGVHMLNTDLIKETIHLSADASIHPESAEKYGTHTPTKTYFHLYSENKILLDVNKKMDELNGLSPIEVARNAFDKHKSQHIWDLAVIESGVSDCRRFGLYDSQVGYSFTTNDIFEGIE